ncbi:NAD(P)H-hydrate dehydratase [Actinoplanes derwentensis]|uniref:Bifunctional NAD(P)H-hydrate repair enzyme n=1 Tax=Actinoplanes derwentensis TaxID=113562 RepID=A0A1H2CKM8_9ACTN|nr:NAD(P)H-hydrate dehydratase [Actinoplanes derwentensis]GID82701.1 bifunctional NAD(P)H-hydrate repair enzyme [Actinoplanes derwentensis]SDT71060.1 yjeF C-terminal region, hydroxyethylthiazole kinase-related/yjeF N-terminal region [Actinoplanes derwentensis]
MRRAWRVSDVRSAEKSLMATLPDGTLMQRAAAGLARRCALLLQEAGGVYGARVLLLVGSGDNGGDTLLAGAALARRGAQVRALLLTPERVHLAGLTALRQAGGFTVSDLPGRSDLVLDGIVGIGASGGLRPAAASIVRRLEDLRDRTGNRPPIVAVDVPSGVTVDTGDVPGEAVTADVTVTFGCLKPAHLIGPAATRCGLVDLIDIGLGPALVTDPAVRVAEAADIAGWWPRPGATSDKYTRGVVGLATGSAFYPGAALLSTAGALAGPSGMVRYAGSAHREVVRAHPSVVVADRVADAGRVQAWVCGSGLGTGDQARTELRSVLATALPVLLDADAINLLVGGEHATHLRRDAPLVLTPHDGEFKRLAGEAPGADRAGAAARLAAWTNAVVLLKGDRTIVATPSGEIWANPTGSPVLATAGSGDVLAGLLGSLLAAGMPAVRAAVTAAYVHGLAGRRAAQDGPVTAPDVASALRPVVADLLG